MRMGSILLIVFGLSTALADGLSEVVFPKCFKALDHRIQQYCNCEIVENKALVLTGLGGLRAKVTIETSVDGLPEVAWILNHVNKSGYPGRLQTLVKKTGDERVWLIEENIRQWDLKPSQEGLSMGRPIRIQRQYKFETSAGECRLKSANISLELKNEKKEFVASQEACSKRPNKAPASEDIFSLEIRKECEAYRELQEQLTRP